MSAYRSTVVALVLVLASVAVSLIPTARARAPLEPVSRDWMAAPAMPHADEPRAPLPDPPKRAYVVAAIGDSITDFRHGGGYVKALRQMCPGSRFDGLGIGGQRLANLRARFADDVLGPRAPKYTHVIVEGGVNDLLVGTMDAARLAEMEGDLSAMYAMARARGLVVIALTVPAWLKATPLQLSMMDALDDFMVDHATAVDVRALLGCKDDAGAVCPEFRRVPVDSVHWGPRGHQLVAEALRTAAFADCE